MTGGAPEGIWSREWSPLRTERLTPPGRGSAAHGSRRAPAEGGRPAMTRGPLPWPLLCGESLGARTWPQEPRWPRGTEAPPWLGVCLSQMDRKHLGPLHGAVRGSQAVLGWPRQRRHRRRHPRSHTGHDARARQGRAQPRSLRAPDREGVRSTPAAPRPADWTAR